VVEFGAGRNSRQIQDELDFATNIYRLFPFGARLDSTQLTEEVLLSS
jgi:hypothetical protein